MSFLVDILRPSIGEGPSWYHLLRKSSGGCNDLIYSGHMFVAVLTAMAWAVCDVFVLLNWLDCSCHICKLPFQCHAILLQLKSALTGQSYPILDMLHLAKTKVIYEVVFDYLQADVFCNVLYAPWQLLFNQPFTFIIRYIRNKPIEWCYIYN